MQRSLLGCHTPNPLGVMTEALAMWTIEDIEALNPEGGQSRFLRHVLRIGAANEKNLCEAAELLEQRGSPYVIGFAQLPFLVRCGESFYRVPGWREGVFFDLAFIPTPVAFTQAGQLTHVSSSAAGAPEDAKAVWLTQVTAVVSLWNKRARLQRPISTACPTPAFATKSSDVSRTGWTCPKPECRFRLAGTHH